MQNKVIQFDALGTSWFIEIAQHETDKHVEVHILSEVRRFEDTYSRFKETSNIGTLNKDKQLLYPTQELQEMLRYALQTYQDTAGVFDISVGSILEQAGYGLESPTRTDLSAGLLHDITISNDEIRISPSLRLDFGGFGKGWLIDAIAALCKKNGSICTVINGGGDILIGPEPTEVFIEHPFDPSLQIGSVRVESASIASSSRHKRTWKHGKNIHTHIVPTKDYSADDIASMHVKAPSALIADTYATVFLLVPAAKRQELAQKLNLEFLEIHADGTFFQTSNFGFIANT